MVEEKRTMLKLTASEDSISLRTVSRGFRPPQRFVVLETELQKLEKERHVISSDIRSFAEMNLVKADTEGRETCPAEETGEVPQLSLCMEGKQEDYGN